MTIESLVVYLTCVHFRGELQHIGDVSEQKFKCRPIRTRETGGVRLSEELYLMQIFSFLCVVNVTDEHMKAKFKRKLIG